MTKRWRVSLIIVLAGLVGCLLWKAWPESEPLYKQKPLTYWLKGFDIGYNEPPPRPAYEDSVEAVRQVGTNSLPILLRMLRTRDSNLRQTLARLAQKQRLIKINYVSADRQRWVAREAFVALGLNAKPAIPQPVEISQQEASRAEWNKYDTEILTLLKQTWPKDVSDDIANALKQSGRAQTVGGVSK